MFLLLTIPGLFSNLTLEEIVVQYGTWVYVFIFISILLASTFIIAPLPGNSLLFVSGALIVNNQLSLYLVLTATISAAYIGYDLNYWSGRLIDLTVCKTSCPHVFTARNTKKSI
jgi:membrane-associated protein